MSKIRDKAEPNIKRKIQSGSSSFWWDNWTGNGALAKLFPRHGKSAKISMKQFIVNDGWNIVKLNQHLPDQLINDIIGIHIGNNDDNDYPLWNTTDNGFFTNKVAWELVRTHKSKHEFMNKIWQSKVPFKVSFLTSIIMRKKRPFQDTLYRFGINRNLTCFCCRNPQPETLKHAFVASEAACFLWTSTGNPLGITHSNEPINSVFKKWWNIKPKKKFHQWILHTHFYMLRIVEAKMCLSIRNTTKIT